MGGSRSPESQAKGTPDVADVRPLPLDRSGSATQSTLQPDTPLPSVAVGVLALQGAVEKHLIALQRLGVSAEPVRFADELDRIHGLIIPGGESTTVGKLMNRYGIDEKIRRRVSEGMHVFGTCTGMILLSDEIEGSDQYRLRLMDAVVRRNAFGRQIDSFEADISIAAIGEPPIRAVFIRAPYALSVGDAVEVLAEFDGKIILYRQGNVLASAFHPELTDDIRIHKLFVDAILADLEGTH